MWIKGLQATSVILITVGTWLLAFGLKVRPGIDQALEKELDLEKKGLVSPSAVRQRPAFFLGGPWVDHRGRPNSVVDYFEVEKRGGEFFPTSGKRS